MYGIKLRVWGEYACFTRPEMKAERVSYDVMTPSAARGILEAIYWKPAIRWMIDKIHVIKPIRFQNIRRNEVAHKIPVRNITAVIADGESPVELFVDDKDNRQQRASMVLKDVEYVIEAHFDILDDNDDNSQKHNEIFKRRARNGKCFHRPYFGCREFPVHFELVEGNTPRSVHQGKVDWGLVLYDIDFNDNMKPIFFHAVMENGIITAVPRHKGGIEK